MRPAHSAFLALLRARTAQRCPGRVVADPDLDAGHITVACDACAARLVLPLRHPERPAPEPPPRPGEMARLLYRITLAATQRWRDHYAVDPSSRYGSTHMPVPAMGTEGAASPPMTTDDDTPPPSTVRSTYGRVHDALLAAGFTEGRRRDNDRHGYTRAAAVPGFILATTADFRAGTTGPEYGRRRLMVDHQGKGQAAAVAGYHAVLVAAGLKVELRSRDGGDGKKLVVWVMED